METSIDSWRAEGQDDAQRLPLALGALSRTFAVDTTGGRVTLGRFLDEVRGLAAQLPAGPAVLNLCEDRYRFLLGFCAAAVRGQITLLPPSRAAAAIIDVQQRHPGSWCLGDGSVPEGAAGFWRMPDTLPRADGPVPRIAGEDRVVIGHTSGSTGAPTANPKHWAGFVASTGQNLAALQDLWSDDAPPTLVVTVPSQHMYGMEMSVLFPLLTDAVIHCAHPFFPADVAAALQQASAPRVLVTTPVHLRALVKAQVALAPLAGIVCSTAPLPLELATAAEAAFGCEVRELFGATETCITARRRTARETAWTPLPGVRFIPGNDGATVVAAHLPAPVAIADLIELLPDGRFELRGRKADMIEIAGKRASLGDLTRRLLAIDGVEDAALLQLDADARGVRRVAALVVAPGVGEGALLEALRPQIDPVFLPRPLRTVARLPRNDTGKLPRAALLALLDTPDAQS
ncbi:MAG: AMP-binding protein [Pseudoxanthomonas suwonensis]|nr:AMP-binding protein [Pseudoxanthomonas suwonensis]